MDHPLSRIEELRNQILPGYTKGFPILKELVQNAEDAKATHLSYGWNRGLSDAEHPLLKSPGLFIINNGKFDEDDAEALFYFKGISSKSDQQGTIGKFGLGLKSVFHLCEAFFYLAPNLNNSEYRNCNIFNPWKSPSPSGDKYCDGYHDNWDDFTKDDEKKIINNFNYILDRSEYEQQKFILWIPLRQEHHTTKEKEDRKKRPLGKITNETFGEQVPDFLLDYNNFHKLANLLPNLHRLKTIIYWEDQEIKYQADLANFRSRLELTELPENNEPITFQGQLIITKDEIEENNVTIDYLGNELILYNPLLQTIINNPNLTTQENTDKIKSHCAVIFSRTCNNSEQSYLTINLATFLPVPIKEDGENKDEVKIKCSSKDSYNLTLHGYFFVNYSRTKITGWDHNHLRVKKSDHTSSTKSREELETEWNFILYNHLLSQILESLSQFADKYSLPPSEIEAICQSLKSSSLFTNNLSTICCKYKYIYRITANAETWELINVNERVLTLPRVPDWGVFTKLGELSNNVYFTLKNKPNLCPKDKPYQWDEQDILAVLESLNPQTIFTKKEHIKYLKSFLEESTKNNLSSKIQDKLTELLKKALSMGITEDLRESIKSLISLIDKDKRLTIKCESYIFQEIYKLELSTLVIPQDVEPSEKSSGELNFDDANKIFHILVQLLHKKSDEQQNIYKFIITFLKKLKPDIRNQVMEENKELKFIYGKQIKEEENQIVKKWYSYSYIKQNENTCFKVTDKENTLAQYLQKALSEHEIILIDTDIADILSIYPCDSEKCLELLAQKPPLADKPKNRVNLLKELLKNV